MINKWWLLGLFISWISCFSSGVFVENKFNIAAQVGIADAQTKRVGEGESKINQFNQDWSKVDAKSIPCGLSLDERNLLH